MGMTYVTSDIHGMQGAFENLLGQIGLKRGDRLYILGDVVDRGPDGIAVLERVLKAKNIILLLGNHEEMLLKSYRGLERARHLDMWLSNGGGPTRDAFEALPKRRREALLDRLERLPDHIELNIDGRRFGLAHACWSLRKDERIWKKPSPWLPMQGVPEGMSVVVGHTPAFLLQADPARYFSRCGGHVPIYHGPHFICVDCGCGMQGHAYRKCCLGCLRLEDGAEFYAVQ